MHHLVISQVNMLSRLVCDNIESCKHSSLAAHKHVDGFEHLHKYFKKSVDPETVLASVVYCNRPV